MDREAFPTAQDVRTLLVEQGWTPLTKIGDSEHWARAGRRCVLRWEGEVPGNVPAHLLSHARLVQLGHAWLVVPD